MWRGSDLRYLVDTAVEAERVGYRSVWAGDSLLARPRGEPLTLLAAVAGATRRVNVGTAVLLPLLRRPVQLAHVLVTLDRVSEGRLIVGVGPGADVPGTREELAAVDASGDRRVSAMLHSLDRCRALWRGDDAHISLLPSPFTPGGPPVWLGAQGPRLLRETGARFEG
jgi:alkanesulfonate monooxygenase SsuD/methylene tetrahydromethanopterin reductase-like flavin-dependent oxidoreductase (luciferase family)